jgi:predicted HicB family RNase H-like nuclease
VPAKYQTDWVRTQLRLPPSLHTKAAEAAKRNHRSLNGEIVAAVEKSVADRKVHDEQPEKIA